jgi:hypothetical protein
MSTITQFIDVDLISSAPHPRKSNDPATKTPQLQPHINSHIQVIFPSPLSSPPLSSDSAMGSQSEPPSSKFTLTPPPPPTRTIISRISQASLQWTGFASLQNLLLFLSTVGVFALFSMSQTTWMRPQAPGGKFWFEGTWWLGWGLKWHAWLMIRMSLLSHLNKTNKTALMKCNQVVGVLLPLQFLPSMRARRPDVHRWLGRLLILGVSLGNIGGMMATHRSFGGTIIAQTSFGTLVAISSFSLWKAWWAIREGRVDRHRIWMLRAWSYICSVSTF